MSKNVSSSGSRQVRGCERTDCLVCSKNSRIPLALAALLVVGSAVLAQPLTLEWTETYVGAGEADGRGVTVTGDALYVTGRTWPIGGYHNMFLLKYDLAGNPVWAPTDRTWGGSNYDGGLKVAVSPGSVYVSGYSFSYAYDLIGDIEADAVTVKWSVDGDIDCTNSSDCWWTRFSGDAGYYGSDSAADLAVDDLDNLYVTGYSERGFGNTYRYTEQYDSSGVKLWHEHYGNPGSYIECRGSALTMDGSYLYNVGGYRTTGDGPFDVLVQKYDIGGTFLWNFPWGGALTHENGYDIAVSGDDVFVTGLVGESDDPDGVNLFLVKLHDDGSSASYVDSVEFVGPGDDIGWGIVEANGILYVVGTTDVGGHTDALMLAYDSSLNLLWDYAWGGDDDDVAYDIAFRSGTLYVTGATGTQAFVNAYSFEDCNDNGVPDSVDISAGTSLDCNTNGTPDECDITIQYLGFADPLNYAAGAAPYAVAIGDLNGDQVPDLAIANDSGGSVSVLLGIGDGTFAPAAHYTCGDSSVSVAIGDLDGDQVPDLAVANASSSNVSVLLGLGDGTFAPAVHYAAGYVCYSVAIDDLNGDQVGDLAVANASSSNVSVLLGLGDGTFAPAVHYAAGNVPVSVAIGDLDSDLVPDLAVANRDSDDVSVLLGIGDGTFAPAVHYAANDYPFFVAIDDLDGDQMPDIAVANHAIDGVSVLLGTGEGVFTDATYYAADDGSCSVAIGDLNSDHVPDLAVANPHSENVSVLLGLGDGTFAAAEHHAAGDYAVSVAIGDLDGDQFADLAVANHWSDDVSVLLNDSMQFSDDCNLNSVPDECDIAEGTSEDCNGNAVPDECEADFDGDGLIDDCDPDIDEDGVLNEDDVCDYTPLNIPRELVEPDGSVLGDLDGDCDVDLEDYAIMQARFSGPNP